MKIRNEDVQVSTGRRGGIECVDVIRETGRTYIVMTGEPRKSRLLPRQLRKLQGYVKTYDGESLCNGNGLNCPVASLDKVPAALVPRR
jgi:hypothetical protein